MYIDNQLVLADAQALTASAASTNTIDLKTSGLHGNGEPMAVVVWTDTVAEAGDADETYNFKVQVDDNEAFSSAADATPNHAIARGSAAGTKLVIPLGTNTPTERYLRVYATLGGTTPSLTVTIALMPMHAIGDWKAHPDGFTISA